MGCLSSKPQVVSPETNSKTTAVVPAAAPGAAAEAPAADEAAPAAEEAPAAAAEEAAPAAAEAAPAEPMAETTATEKDSPADVNESDDKWKDEKLRRWSISWQFTAGPFDVDETVHGPVKLHWDNKVVSVGTTDDCQLKIEGDSEIQPEHGMISFREDKLLYVNSSEAPTKIDDVDVDPEAGPTDLKNGAVLSIGGTKLVVTCYTEFDPAC